MLEVIFMNKTYMISDQNGTAVSKPLVPAEFSDAGQQGWSIQTYSAAGIDYVQLCAEENADVFPLHKDTNEWFGYVVEGSGELHIGDADNVTETIAYNAGDIIIVITSYSIHYTKLYDRSSSFSRS